MPVEELNGDPQYWKWTGLCPECWRRSVTGGRCITCGWESEERQDRDRQVREATRQYERWLDQIIKGNME